jgi:GMP synthase-like glutamine amidotransferase
MCFGHQIIARALGGECVPNDQLEIGPTLIDLTDLGKSIFEVGKLVNPSVLFGCAAF